MLVSLTKEFWSYIFRYVHQHDRPALCYSSLLGLSEYALYVSVIRMFYCLTMFKTFIMFVALSRVLFVGLFFLSFENDGFLPGFLLCYNTVGKHFISSRLICDLSRKPFKRLSLPTLFSAWSEISRCSVRRELGYTSPILKYLNSTNK